MKATRFGSQVDKLFANGGGVSFGSLVEASKMDETIQQKLEQVNTRTIDTNPVSRIRAAIQTLNRNLGKMEVEVNGRKLDTKHIKFTVPECAKEKSYTALGNYQGRTAKLELVVIL